MYRSWLITTCLFLLTLLQLPADTSAQEMRIDPGSTWAQLIELGLSGVNRGVMSGNPGLHDDNRNSLTSYEGKLPLTGSIPIDLFFLVAEGIREGDGWPWVPTQGQELLATDPG